MDTFNHFLITRFNVISSEGFDQKYPADRNIIYGSRYLQYRFDLFDKYCYPTVRAQSAKNFKWIVFFGFLTPEIFHKKIKEYAKWPNFIPVYIDEFNIEILKKINNEYKTGNPQFLITTRLDSDDGICNDYLQMVQDNFKEQSFQIINFYWGYYLSHPIGKLYLRGRVDSTFLSLIEKTDRAETVWLRNIAHYRLHGIYKPQGLMKNIILKDKPAWVVVFHGRNLANKSDLYNAVRQPKEKLIERFNIQLPDKDRYENKFLIKLDQSIFYFRHMKFAKFINKQIANLRIRVGRYRAKLIRRSFLKK
ncbi:MAG: hypothetical protein JSW17_01900 [Candidatus Omnitrophota bacterium]|nr:MAG: hypothetical protein JSW17_01900 [Candidatus Omnitrophota bacterium]